MNANSLKDSVANAKAVADEAVDTAAEKASQLGRKARDNAADVVEDAKEFGQTASRKIRAQASEAAAAAEDRLDDLSNAAQSGFRSAKSKLADGGDRLAKALHDAADGTRAASGRVVEAVAGGVSDVADHLRAGSISDLVSSTKAYARRNPGTVAIGAAALGFVFAQLLQSKSRNPGRRG